MIDQILEKLGLKYEDLNSIERETLQTWTDAMSKRAVTIESIKQYIAQMKFSVEQDLSKSDNNTRQDIFLKARLRNYMLLEAFLTTPERAKQAMEQAISGFGKKA